MPTPMLIWKLSFNTVQNILLKDDSKLEGREDGAS